MVPMKTNPKQVKSENVILFHFEKDVLQLGYTNYIP